jgi:hypothetical protein
MAFLYDFALIIMIFIQLAGSIRSNQRPLIFVYQTGFINEVWADAAVTFKGLFVVTHWAIVSPQGSAGVWRYVEQEASSEIAMNQNQKVKTLGSKSSHSKLKYSALTNKAMTIVQGTRMDDITGKMISTTNFGR